MFRGGCSFHDFRIVTLTIFRRLRYWPNLFAKGIVKMIVLSWLGVVLVLFELLTWWLERNEKRRRGCWLPHPVSRPGSDAVMSGQTTDGMCGAPCKLHAQLTNVINTLITQLRTSLCISPLNTTTTSYLFCLFIYHPPLYALYNTKRALFSTNYLIDFYI